MTTSPATVPSHLVEAFARRTVEVLVGADTFDPLAERIRGMLTTDRSVVLVRRNASDRGADDLTIETGLRLDRRTETSVQEQTWNLGGTRHRQLAISLYRPGRSAMLSFSADERTAAQMQPSFDARGINYDHPVTRVRIIGRPGDPDSADRIEVEAWNEHRVCTLTTLAFDPQR